MQRLVLERLSPMKHLQSFVAFLVAVPQRGADGGIEFNQFHLLDSGTQSEGLNRSNVSSFGMSLILL